MLYDFDDAPTRKDPKIRYTFPEFEGVDDSYKLRWRAMWHMSHEDGLPAGIELRCYPVVRKTPCGAWIDPNAYRLPTAIMEDATRREWCDPPKNVRRMKFVFDHSNAAWAKPTRAAALRSLGIRLLRWSFKVRCDVEQVNAACDVASTLLSASDFTSKPDHAFFFEPDNSVRRLRIEVKE